MKNEVICKVLDASNEERAALEKEAAEIIMRLTDDEIKKILEAILNEKEL